MSHKHKDYDCENDNPQEHLDPHHHYHNKFDMDHKVRFGIVIVLNGLLTIAQVFAGLFSGSLSLLADALHNFSDMISLVIAFVSHIISQKPDNERKTFSYRRAEIIGAFINVILLFSTGLYLVFEAILRFSHPQVIKGGIVIAIASIALVIDLATALIVYLSPKKTMNIRVAFLHNLSDALASVAVIITGFLIVKYEFYFVDSLVTFLIAGYVMYHAYLICPRIINILMNNTPSDKMYEAVEDSLTEMKEIKSVHHLHIWKLDEDRIALECHLVVEDCMLKTLEKLRKKVKNILKERHKISHSSIEFECIVCEGDKFN